MEQAVVKTRELDVGRPGIHMGTLGGSGTSRLLFGLGAVAQAAARVADKLGELSAPHRLGRRGEREHEGHVHAADDRDVAALAHELDHGVVNAAAQHVGADVYRIRRVERVDERFHLLGDGILVITLERDDVDVLHVAEDHRQRVAGAFGEPAVRCQN